MAFTSGTAFITACCTRKVSGDGLGEADGGQLFELHDDVAFVHGRHEGLAEGQIGAGGGHQRGEGEGAIRRPRARAKASRGM
jgi:hypothetical protein